MLLNLNFKIKDLEGKEILKSDPVNKIVANGLAADNDKRDPLKFMEMARNLYTKGEIEIDQSDSKMLREKIQGFETFTIILKAAVIEAIDKATKDA